MEKLNEKKTVRKNIASGAGEFKLQKKHKEIASTHLPSATVPNEALTPRQLLERFSRNQPTDVSVRESVFDPSASFDSYDLEKLKDLDPVDKSRISKLIGQDIAEFEKAIEAQKAKAAAEKAAELERQKELDSLVQEGKKKRQASASGEANQPKGGA